MTKEETRTRTRDKGSESSTVFSMGEEKGHVTKDCPDANENPRKNQE
jgi:hypothetical protein